MKVRLLVELSVSDEYVAPEDADPSLPKYVEVEREFELPFAPFPGLRIQMPCVAFSFSAKPPAEDAAATPPLLVTGIFRIADVLFCLEQRAPPNLVFEEYFHARALQVYEDPEALASAAATLEALYGFARVSFD